MFQEGPAEEKGRVVLTLLLSIHGGRRNRVNGDQTTAKNLEDRSRNFTSK